MKMNKIKMAIVGVSALVLSIFALSVQAVPIVMNGSFEMAITPAGTPIPPSFAIPVANTTALPFWTVAGPITNGFLDCVVFPGTATTSVCGGAHRFAVSTDPGLSPDRGNYIAFDGDSTVRFAIMQTINDLVKDQLYNVSYWQTASQLAGYIGPTTEQWEVSLGTTEPHQFSKLMNNASQSFVPLMYDTLTFKASVTGSEVLTFLAKGTPDGLPPFVLLDGVSITAVQEPETYALLGIGLLGILAVRRQQKKRA